MVQQIFAVLLYVLQRTVSVFSELLPLTRPFLGFSDKAFERLECLSLVRFVVCEIPNPWMVFRPLSPHFPLSAGLVMRFSPSLLYRFRTNIWLLPGRVVSKNSHKSSRLKSDLIQTKTVDLFVFPFFCLTKTFDFYFFGFRFFWSSSILTAVTLSSPFPVRHILRRFSSNRRAVWVKESAIQRGATLIEAQAAFEPQSHLWRKHSSYGCRGIKQR